MPAIHRLFDYTVPDRLVPGLRVGSRVRIELHGRRVGGWIVDDRVTDSPVAWLKPLAASSGDGPPPEVVALARWAAWRWAGPLSSFLGTASPPRVTRGAYRTDAGTAPPASCPSPGGGSVTLVDRVLDGPPTGVVVRLAPALDAGLVVQELLHRVGSEGVLVLAPATSRAEQLAGRLEQLGLPVALLPEGWARAASQQVVVVGTRAAAWAPIATLRAAVVLDAHDEAYREERSPTWSAVDVVVERARRDGAPVALVTPCPTVELVHHRPTIVTGRAVERRGWPAVELIDRTGDDPRTGLFSERLVRHLRDVLGRPAARAVCVLNRTGRARLLACAHCGTLVRCTRCGGAMAQDAAGEGLWCRRCGERRPRVCAACDAGRLKVLRIGVTRATEELSALTGVAATEVTGQSADATGGSLAAARLVVGTEAALHRVLRADTVAFLDVDQHLLAPRFAAADQTMALLARSARLLGPREGLGRLLVQTRIPDHEVLRAAVRADPGIPLESERAVRAALGLPPFGALAVLRGPGAAPFAASLAAMGDLAVSADGEAWLVRAEDHTLLCDGLGAVPRPPDRLRVEVDPVDV